jgi:hypothetical protein
MVQEIITNVSLNEVKTWKAQLAARPSWFKFQEYKKYQVRSNGATALPKRLECNLFVAIVLQITIMITFLLKECEFFEFLNSMLVTSAISQVLIQADHVTWSLSV